MNIIHVYERWTNSVLAEMSSLYIAQVEIAHHMTYIYWLWLLSDSENFDEKC